MIWGGSVGGVLKDAFTNFRFFLSRVLLSSTIICKGLLSKEGGVGIGMAEIGFIEMGVGLLDRLRDSVNGRFGLLGACLIGGIGGCFGECCRNRRLADLGD